MSDDKGYLQPSFSHPRVMPVIIQEILVGKGTHESVARRVVFVWDMAGRLIATSEVLESEDYVTLNDRFDF